MSMHALLKSETGGGGLVAVRDEIANGNSMMSRRRNDTHEIMD